MGSDELQCPCEVFNMIEVQTHHNNSACLPLDWACRELLLDLWLDSNFCHNISEFQTSFEGEYYPFYLELLCMETF